VQEWTGLLVYGDSQLCNYSKDRFSMQPRQRYRFENMVNKKIFVKHDLFVSVDTFPNTMINEIKRNRVRFIDKQKKKGV
jgi:hypothetical protein